MAVRLSEINCGKVSNRDKGLTLMEVVPTGAQSNGFSAIFQ